MPFRPDASFSFSCVLGFDVGARRIGVAVGNTISATARALSVVDARDGEPDWPAVERLLREWSPQRLLVGEPLTLSGEAQPITRTARRFAEELRARSGLPVELVDERFSSIEADRRFAQRRASGQARRKQAAQLDAMAAEVIVEQWLRQGAAGEKQ